jgi:hypothetical protein
LCAAPIIKPPIEAAFFMLGKSGFGQPDQTATPHQIIKTRYSGGAVSE